MAVKQKSEIMDILKNLLKDNTSDEALSMVEDVSDTFDELHNKATGDGTDWKKKYEENDAEWRQRYKDRFFEGTPNGDGGAQNNNNPTDTHDDNDDNNTPKQYKFEDLFTDGDKKGANNA